MLNFNIPQARHTTDHTVDIARSVPIETELGRRGIHLRRQGRELVGPCPVCGGCSGTDRFKVSTAKNVFNCFACDAGGDVIALVQQLDGSDFLGAVETLAGNATRYVDPAVTAARQQRQREAEEVDRAERQHKSEHTGAIWDAAIDWRGTDGETYLRNRGIETDAIPADAHLRWHPQCAWEPSGSFMPCLVARFTDVVTGAPAGIQRIGVRDGHKVDKFSKGPVSGCVVRLWPNDAIKNGIVLGEGVETTLAAATRLSFKGTLLRPAWATRGTASMQTLPVLSGIEFLTILVDNDASQAGQKAAAKCAVRWQADGRHVLRLIPKISDSDFNDLIR
jgi:phage/plasmid primase-like uncharacterized protein